MKGQSHLTRQIFRAIIANKPYRIPGCQLTPTATARPVQSRKQHQVRSFHSSQKRQLFEWIEELPRALAQQRATPQNLERAYFQLGALVKARRAHARPPVDKVVVDTLKFLFSVRAQNPGELNKTEVFLITESLQHLLDRDNATEQDQEKAPEIDKQDLQNLSAALSAYGAGEAFATDARVLGEVIIQYIQKLGEKIDGDIFGDYVKILARSGSLNEAFNLIRRASALPIDEAMLLWVAVLKNEKRPAQFKQRLNELTGWLGPLTPEAHENLVVGAASNGYIGLCRELLSAQLRDNERTTTAAYLRVLQLGVDKGQHNLAALCARSVQERDDVGSHAGILYLWYATENPSPRPLKQRILERQQAGYNDEVSMRTFNHLVKYAYRDNDPRQVQRYLELAQFFGLRPDGATQALSLDYYLARGEENAAVSSFEALMQEDVPDDRSEVPVLNRFLQTLTALPEPPMQLIMRVVDRVLETGADLDASTIAGICSVFLKKGEEDELAGIVRYRVDALNRVERAGIITVFRQYILDPTIGEQKAFTTYDLLVKAFPELEVADRRQIMQYFFDRKRPDLATQVFLHMRQATEPEQRPTAEAYAQCFYGIATCKDVDGLQMVYNMLKIDREVEINTRLHNALIAAYPACRIPFTAIIDHFWKVLDSREGPTLSTFLLAFRACEVWVPYGSLEARRIMALMQSWDMIITKEIYDAYLGVVAGQSEFENAIELIEHMEEDIGKAPDAITIGIFYNAIPWQYRKDEVEKWAKRVYPELWGEVESWGDVVDEEWDVRYFKVNREIDTDDELLFGEGEYAPELGQRARAAIGEPSSYQF